MPLKTRRELMEDPEPRKPSPPSQITYVVPETEPVFTVDLLAALIAKHPEFGRPGEFAFYEVDRLTLGDGLALVTAETFRFGVDAA